MKIIVKTLGVVIEILLMAIAVLWVPLWFALALHDRIRYGIKMPNIFGDLVDVLKSLWDNILEIISF